MQELCRIHPCFVSTLECLCRRSILGKTKTHSRTERGKHGGFSLYYAGFKPLQAPALALTLTLGRYVVTKPQIFNPKIQTIVSASQRCYKP